ncbi:apolipoprotein O [Austrofundulus limnaeus]|uniref:MICOS complex subunit n=1 Tax=Austrofundulus limnaeus TaxID=52670 RepID=A0A2I4BL97_AUSLI|nr:PREDICTED: apolipoprotein O-like [Austrofundulus limnaeus]
MAFRGIGQGDSQPAMPGAPRLQPFAVFAAEPAGDGEQKAATSLNLDELSVYAAPQQNLRHAELEAGQVEERVATLRKLAEPYTSWCQGAYGQIKPKVQNVVQFGNDTYGYLQNPPKDFYPRAGIIGFAGVLGLFLARGSRVKKLLYPAGFVAVAASLYYPEQAAAVAKSTGDSVYEFAVQGYASVEKILKSQSKDRNKPENKP